MNPYRYSPLDISSYYITSLPMCEARKINSFPHPDSDAVWNLFWLSMPSVDALPLFGQRADWNRGYFPTEGALGAIVSDAVGDEHLARLLLLHPSRFLRGFEIDDHTLYESYEVLGERKWVDTVMERAAQSARHMASEVPELLRSNVYPIRGRQAA